MKVFISMPMAGKSKQGILQERQEIIDKLSKRFKVVDILADADIVCVSRDWYKDRGCRVECEVAREYNIPILVMEEYLKQE